MATINGSDLMLFINKGNKKQSIALATSHSLEVSCDTKDLSTKDNGLGRWSNSEAGLASWTVTTENLCSDTASTGLSYNDLFDIFLNRKPVDIYFTLQTDIPEYITKIDEDFQVPTGGWTPSASNYYHGSAIVTSLSLTAANGEKANFSCTLNGCGALMRQGTGFSFTDVSTGTASVQTLNSTLKASAAKA